MKDSSTTMKIIIIMIKVFNKNKRSMTRKVKMIIKRVYKLLISIINKKVLLISGMVYLRKIYWEIMLKNSMKVIKCKLKEV